MQLIKEMRRIHEANKLDFQKLKEQKEEKKKAFMEHLEKMKHRMDNHGSVFQSVQKLSDKLPKLFGHFKNLLTHLGKKEIEDSETKSSESSSSNSSNNIEEHENTVEEEAFGPNSDEDDDEEDESIEQKEDEEKEEEEEAEEGKEEDLDEVADSLDEKLKEINEHPNFVSLDDELLDKLEQEQKEFELRQKELNEHVNGFKHLDDGLVYNGKQRRNFNDRFIKFLNEEEMKHAPKSAKEHLRHLNDLFNAREH